VEKEREKKAFPEAPISHKKKAVHSPEYIRGGPSSTRRAGKFTYQQIEQKENDMRKKKNPRERRKRRKASSCKEENERGESFTTESGTQSIFPE